MTENEIREQIKAEILDDRFKSGGTIGGGNKPNLMSGHGLHQIGCNVTLLRANMVR